MDKIIAELQASESIFLASCSLTHTSPCIVDSNWYVHIIFNASSIYLELNDHIVNKYVVLPNSLNLLFLFLYSVFSGFIHQPAWK